MALVRYGGGVVQASGSIAGDVFARNRYGNYTRARTKPINPNSSYQQAVRSAVAYLTQEWRDELTAAQRTAWETYANSIVMKNRLGENIKLTGFTHFIRSNSIRLVQGGVYIEDGPTVLALPEKDVTFAVTASVATQLLSIAFNNTLGWAGEVGGFMALYMGVPQRPTRTFFGGPWRYTGWIPGAATPPTSPQTKAAAFTLVLGQKVWVYARILRADGRLSETFMDDCIVAA